MLRLGSRAAVLRRSGRHAFRRRATTKLAASPRDPRGASAASGAIRHGSRVAVLSQAGAPLSWTSEGADTLFVCERVRKAAANKRQPQRAERAMHARASDTLFVGERRRSWRLPRAIRAERAQRAEQSNSAVDLDGDVHARHQWQALQVVDHDLDRDHLGHLLEVSRGVGLRK
jgi:hypothetical protein